MKRCKSLVAKLWAILFIFCSGGVMADPGELDSAEAGALEYLLLFSELKQNYFETGIEQWGNSALAGLAADEQQNMDALENLATHYAVEISIYYWGCNVLFWEFPELDFYCFVMTPNPDWWESWEGYVSTAAYFEELGIRELKQALSETDEQSLTEAYTAMLDMAYVHLLNFASILHEDPFDYESQLLVQADVDRALAEAIGMSSENFVINSGLNDVWYDSLKSGQGFTVSVFEDKGTVFLTWLTFDTELPGQNATANLGNAGQRWLTAHGAYEGAQVELVVYSSSGGLFDSALPVPVLDPVGSIVLQFTDCFTGEMTYELPGIGRSGSIQIKRVATDNLCNCVDGGYPDP